MSTARKTPQLQSIEHISRKITDRLPASGHDAARKINIEVTKVKSGLEALENLHSARNPLDSQAAHERRISTAAQKFANEVKSSSERMYSILRDGLNDIERRVGNKINLTPDAYGAEVRQVFRSMSSSDQIKMLNTLVQQGRGPELAAILKAPETLTGMSKDMQDKYTAAVYSTHAPAEYAEQLALLDVISDASVITPVALNAAKSFTDPMLLASIEKAEKAAKAADADFQNALNGEVTA